ASLGSMFKNAATSSEGVLRATGHLEATLSRVDSSTASGELADLLTDARAAAGELRSASANVNLVAGTAADQRENLAEVMTSAARLMERLERGEGTLGLLTSDSTLYREATLTVVQLRSLI